MPFSCESASNRHTDRKRKEVKVTRVSNSFSDAKTTADKYITAQKTKPLEINPVAANPCEIKWMKTAVRRGGWMPYKIVGRDDGAHAAQLRSMQKRGIVSGPPWKITKLGREILAKGIEVGPILFLPPVADCPVRPLAEIEREYIIQALHHCGGNKTEAAKLLDISVRTVRNKVNLIYAAADRER